MTTDVSESNSQYGRHVNFGPFCSVSEQSPGSEQSPAAGSKNTSSADIITVCHTKNDKTGRSMDTTSSFIKSVTKRVWSPPQRPFRVCCHNRETRKGITAGTLEELKERVCQALLLSLSALSLVCEEDGTEVDSDEFLMTLPDNIMLMALVPGQTWRPQAGTVVLKSPGYDKPRTGKDIASVTFDLYKTSPKDVFGSLNVKATFQGLYSVSADFQCLGPKKILREVLRVASSLLHTAGHLLITSASLIRRVIEGAELWQPQRAEYNATWN